jgi:hypothetical protein
MFSSLKKTGMEETEAVIGNWLNPAGAAGQEVSPPARAGLGEEG